MDNPRFLIKKVIINNFRGYSYGTFEFFKDKDEKRGLILLGGPNGYGKTSLLDAVEWCLSGTIRRIQEDYEIRKETSNTLQRGLIRHNPSKKDVSVFIEADIQGNIITLERIFDKNQESAAFSLD
ncbi:AAA family ATPase, partial [Bacillus paranthracis]|nr:AAA family ATPase [Bacillus paranthracis]